VCVCVLAHVDVKRAHKEFLSAVRGQRRRRSLFWVSTLLCVSSIMSGIVVKLGLVNGRITHEMIRIPHWSLNQQQQQQKIWLHFSHFSWKKKNFLNYWNSFAPDPFASAGGLLHAFKIGRRRWWSRSVRATFFFSSFKHAHDPKYIRLEGFVLSLSPCKKKKKKDEEEEELYG
jgi:hypothetical protein